jgi:hypothetical protein
MKTTDTVKQLVCMLRICAVNNHVDKLLVYDSLGRPHDLPIPNSPTVHSFVGDLLTLRSHGLEAIIANDKEKLGLSTPLNKT